MVTIDQLADYLGSPASALLSAPPFSAWRVERSVERDLSPRRIYYEFLDLGLEFLADAQDNVSSIFVFFDDERSFRVRLAGVSGSSTRSEMLEWLGTPSKSGTGTSDPIMGDTGAWDRFATPGYAIHLQYQLNDDRLKAVTLMRPDDVP